MSYRMRLVVGIVFLLVICGLQVVLAIRTQSVAQSLIVPFGLLLAVSGVAVFFVPRARIARQRELMLKGMGKRYIAEVRLSHWSREQLGDRIGPGDSGRFSLVVSDQEIELWGASDTSPAVILPWCEVAAVEPAGLTDPQHGSGTVLIETRDGWHPLQIVGPIWGAYPASPRREQEVAAEVNTALHHNADT